MPIPDNRQRKRFSIASGVLSRRRGGIERADRVYDLFVFVLGRKNSGSKTT